MYVEDQAHSLLTSLHTLLSVYKMAYEEVLQKEIEDELVEMAADGQIQLVGPELYMAPAPNVDRLSWSEKRERGTIQRLWNVDGASAREIGRIIGRNEEHVAAKIGRMRQQGWRMLRHRKGGGLDEILAPCA